MTAAFFAGYVLGAASAAALMGLVWATSADLEHGGATDVVTPPEDPRDD